MSFSDLHLEDTYVPEEYEDSQDDLFWENDEYEPFNLTVQAVTFKGREAVSYSMDLMPLQDEGDDWAEVMSALEKKGHDTDGYGWEAYLVEFIAKEHPELAARVETDSESETCGLYVLDSPEDYEALLALVSQAIRELL